MGAENLPQFEASGKPFVVLIQEGPDGPPGRLEFDQEAQVVEFYRMTLRMGLEHGSKARTAVIPRELSLELVEALRQAAKEFALETAPSRGSA